MKSKFLKFIFIASLALNVSVLAAAGFVYYRHSSGYWVTPFGDVVKKDYFLFEELSLRPDQMTRMKEKGTAFREEIDRKRKEILEKRKELFALFREENADPARVEATIAGISGMQEEMQRRVAAHILEVKALLDKDQRQGFLNLLERSMKKGGHPGCSSIEQN
ncbi:MAG TPA: periplasmic heavy metal sensor [Syntrophales bacterium]|nr:periplasmic heavy metal sensor [Syntrophales bacterium]